jgi:hypothetical protein
MERYCVLIRTYSESNPLSKMLKDNGIDPSDISIKYYLTGNNDEIDYLYDDVVFCTIKVMHRPEKDEHDRIALDKLIESARTVTRW